MKGEHRNRIAKAVVAALLLGLFGAALAVLLRRGETIPSTIEVAPSEPASSERAFQQSYLDALNGKETAQRVDCKSCHETTRGKVQPASHLLNRRAGLSREAWANAISLQTQCGACHLMPPPSSLARQSWTEVIARMEEIMVIRKLPKPTAAEILDILHFYLTFSPEHHLRLADDPDPASSPRRFTASAFGNSMGSDTRDRSILGNVSKTDLDADGLPDVLVCDTKESAVTWINRRNGTWQENTLAKVPFPGHTQTVTNGNGGLDIVVACLGAMGPTDDLVGSVVLLVNDGNLRFTPRTLLTGVSRVADVEPGDFDGDGDVDFVVAAYGWINQGEVGWLENKSDATYAYHPIVKRTGAIHVAPIDLNGDGPLDFVALFAQEHEIISALMNDGRGGFQERILFRAATPSFGLSGLQLVDLDRDGDADILFTNGDNMDLPAFVPRPYHGVQWLENKGELKFVRHDIHRFYGAYCAVAGDLNHDGHLDIVVTSMFNDWSDPKRASLIWLENDGQQRFTPRGIARQPIHLISATVGDFDGYGASDIVTCGMNGFPPLDRMGRITLWQNQRPRR